MSKGEYVQSSAPQEVQSPAAPSFTGTEKAGSQPPITGVVSTRDAATRAVDVNPVFTRTASNESGGGRGGSLTPFSTVSVPQDENVKYEDLAKYVDRDSYVLDETDNTVMTGVAYKEKHGKDHPNVKVSPLDIQS